MAGGPEFAHPAFTMKILFTAEAVSKSGRSGTIQSPDGLLNLTLGNPLEDGIEERGPNPELLFAGAYSACFHGAIVNAGKILGMPVKGCTVRALVSLVEDAQGGYRLALELHAQIPGLNTPQVQRIMDEAQKTCPYSKALHGETSVTLVVDNPDIAKISSFPKVIARVSSDSLARRNSYSPDISIPRVISILERHRV